MNNENSHDKAAHARRLAIHIREVGLLLQECSAEITRRIVSHDCTRFDNIEWDSSLLMAEKMRQAEFGSPEYYRCRQEILPAIEHHYAKNRHHPEHFPRGVNDMNLIDVLEMVADWAVSAKSQVGGSVEDSLKVNQGRFDISDQLQTILQNTVRDYGWGDKSCE